MAMKIVGYVEDVNESAKDAEAKQFLKQVYEQLKANPGKGLMLDVDAKDRQDAVKIVKKLSRLAKSMGAAYKLLVLEVEFVGDTGFEVKARLKPNTHRKFAKNAGKKGNANGAGTCDGNAGQQPTKA